MDQSQLRPDLWQTLPNHLVDKIIDNFLADLPFSRIFRFCWACKRWTDVLLSAHYILYLHDNSCMILNPRSARPCPESIPLPFRVVEGFGSRAMQQVSCGEGQLVLSSPLSTLINHEVIVYNPLIRRYDRFTRPFWDMVLPRLWRGLWTIDESTWTVAFGRVGHPLSVSSPVCPHNLLVVGVGCYSETVYFHLVVKRFYQGSKEAMYVWDSRWGRWENVSGASKNFSFVVEPTLSSEGNIILGLGECLGGVKVLTYDIGLMECQWISLETISRVPNATSRSGKILIATLRGGPLSDHELEFFDVNDVGRTMKISGPASFPPSWTKGPRRNAILHYLAATSLRQVRETSDSLRIVPVRDGEIVHYVSVLKRLPTSKFYVSVCSITTINQADSSTQDRAQDSSVRTSSWKEWEHSGLGYDDLPSASHFHIFKPSLLGMRLSNS